MKQRKQRRTRKPERSGTPIWDNDPYYDAYVEIRRVRLSTPMDERYCARLKAAYGEQIDLLAVTAPEPGKGPIAVFINRLVAHRADLSQLHDIHRRLAAKEHDSHLFEAGEAIAEASKSIQRKLAGAKDWTESMELVEGIKGVATAISNASEKWKWYLDALLQPCLILHVPLLTYEYECEIVADEPGANKDVMLDLYLLVRRPITKG